MIVNERAIQNILGIINRVTVAMLTTAEADNNLHSRPLATLRTTDFSGFLWFFTAADSLKIAEIREHREVSLSYSDPVHHCYASISGKGTVIRDPEKMAERWNPLVKIWFPDGLDDPNLVLLKISVDKAEYWDASGSTAQRLAAFSKALTTGNAGDIGEHEKLPAVPSR